MAGFEPAASRPPDECSYQTELHPVVWWSRWDLNPRPPASHAGALPTELRPLCMIDLLVWWGGRDSNPQPPPTEALLPACPPGLEKTRAVTTPRSHVPVSVTPCPGASCVAKTVLPVGAPLLLSARVCLFATAPVAWCSHGDSNPGFAAENRASWPLDDESHGPPGRIRTPNLLIRSQALCPVELQAD